MNLKPLSDHVLVRKHLINQKSKGGIILPDVDKKSRVRCFIGTVLAVGGGRKYINGKCYPIEVDVGDTIIFNKFTGIDLDCRLDPELIVLRECDVYGKLVKLKESP